MRETPNHGNTVWAVYSALTYFASHDSGDFSVRDTGNDHANATLIKREEDVADWVKSAPWLRLAE